jgi:hypothetical protein
MIFEKEQAPDRQSACSVAEARGFEPRMGVNPNRISSLRVAGYLPTAVPTLLWFCLRGFSLCGCQAVQERGGERIARGERVVDDRCGAS